MDEWVDGRMTECLNGYGSASEFVCEFVVFFFVVLETMNDDNYCRVVVVVGLHCSAFHD